MNDVPSLRIDSGESPAPAAPTGAPAAEAPASAPKKPSPLLAGSVALFALIAVASGYFVYQDWSYGEKISKLRGEISGLGTEIATLKADPTVAAAELIERQKAELETEVARSQPQKYVSEFVRLHRDYGVDFDGFAFTDTTISTVVSAAKPAEGVDPIDRLVRFIGDFRAGTGSAAASPLVLGEVRSVSGDELRRSFSVEFKIK